MPRGIAIVVACAMLLAGVSIAFYAKSGQEPVPGPVAAPTTPGVTDANQAGSSKADPSTSKTSRVSRPNPVALTVTAVYPGADAATIATTVGVPIEQQVSGVENLLSMSSVSASDGSYFLQILFQPGTSIDQAQVLVQNRVSLAVPTLPTLVQERGLSVFKRSPEPLVLVSLTSDGQAPPELLGKYAMKQVRQELARLTGVSDVLYFGPPLLPEASPPESGEATPVERARRLEFHATFHDKPAVVLGVYAIPGVRLSDLGRAVQKKLQELRNPLPPGWDLDVAFDALAAGDYLVIDAELPDGASTERTAAALQQAAEVLRTTVDLNEVLTLTEHPFSLDRRRPCLIAHLTAKTPRPQATERIRTELAKQVPVAQFRVCGQSSDGTNAYGFPIEFVLEDHGDHGNMQLWQQAEAMVARMKASGKFVDPGVRSGFRSVPTLSLEIDRGKATELGLAMDDIIRAIETHLGQGQIDDFDPFSRKVIADFPLARQQGLSESHVINQQQQAVPLGAVVSVREVQRSKAIERHNLFPCARITADLASGVSAEEAKSLCEQFAEQELDASQFKLAWPAR